MIQQVFNGEKWRVITPILQTVLAIVVTTMLWFAADIKTDMRDLATEYKLLANHLREDISSVQQRLATLEAKMEANTMQLGKLSNARPR